MHGILIRVMVFMVLALAGATDGLAVCVSPSSSPSLYDELVKWGTRDDTTITIDLEQGTYAISAIIDQRGPGPNACCGSYGHNANLVIRGGYKPGTACDPTQRSKDASLTVLDGTGNSRFELWINGTVSVSVLTFKNYTGPYGVNFFGLIGGASTLDVTHVIGTGNETMLFQGGTPSLQDVVATLQPPSAQPALQLVATDQYATATHLTVAANGGYGFSVANQFGGNIPVEIFNSIFYNNTSGDITGYDANDNKNVKVYSSIATVSSSPASSTYIPPGQLVYVSATDPKFVNGLHLSTSPGSFSPAINAGTTAVLGGEPATDIEGNPRIIGGAPDMGAYEANTPFYSTYLVTMTADNGSDAAPTVNSLRWALNSARADAQSQLSGPPRRMQIAFSVPCPSMLGLNTAHPLQAIDFDVTIDATTNPGWSPPNASQQPGFSGTLCVGINGSGTVANAFHVVAGGRATIEGMRFGGFSDAAIRIDDSSGSLVFGNQIGGAGAGLLGIYSNHDGVRISGTASGNFIGAFDDFTTRNQISDNDDVGVYIDSNAGSGGAPNYVVGNLIGLASNGTSAFPNGDDVYVYNSPGNVIEVNTIGGAANTGITLSGASTQNTFVRSNLIGLPETGDSDVSNGTYAILISAGAANNTIGAGLAQEIGGNGIAADATGVYVSPSGGIGNRILDNAIVSGTGLPIDLGTLGPTPNDALDADTGADNLQNYPVVLHAHRTTLPDGTPGYLWVEGTLDSAPFASYRLDAYWMCCAGASGRGMPQLPLGYASATTDGSGHSHFWIRLPSPAVSIPTISLGAISATATDSAGDTSEVGIVGTEDTDMIFRDDLERH
ncbi:MAG TPA: right-handed parallel beta-helix repeat-containing protein [Rudaea sp.]|nr:right-handed parallel beta-helix repeat-containing protein [Rudaea sp.]